MNGVISDREQAVINLVAQGLTNIQVAEHLNVTAATVKTHLQQIFKKTGAQSRAEMVAITQGKIAIKTSAEVVDVLTRTRESLTGPEVTPRYGSAAYFRRQGELNILDHLLAQISALAPARRPGLPMSQEEHERQAKLREMSK